MCWKHRPRQSPRRSVLLYYSWVQLQVWFRNLFCFSLFLLLFLDPLISFLLFSFILSLIFISTFHLYARWLVLILVPSALPISPHAVVVRLKHIIQASLLHWCDQGVSCSALNAEVAAFSLDILGLFLILYLYNACPPQLNFQGCHPCRQTIFQDLVLVWPRTFSSSAHSPELLRSNPTFYLSTQSPLTKTSPLRADLCSRLGSQAQYMDK